MEERILLPQSSISLQGSSPGTASSSGDAGHLPAPVASQAPGPLVPHPALALPTPSAASPIGREEGTEAPRKGGAAKFREYLFRPPLRFLARINDVML